MKIRLVVSGRSYPASGSLPQELTLPEGASLEEALELLQQQFSEGNSLPPTCMLALSGAHLGTLATHQTRTLCDGDELVVIAPVAGG